MEDEVLDIADNPHIGESVTEEQMASGAVVGRVVRRADQTEHRKIRIEARLKVASNWRYYSPVRYLLPKIASAADIPAAFEAVAEHLRAGSITHAEFEAARRFLDGYREAFGQAEAARRLAEVEAILEEIGAKK